METQEALERLRAAREAVQDAYDALDAAKDALTATKQAVGLALGPFKIGDRVQRKGSDKVYEIVRADVMTIHDKKVYAEFYDKKVYAEFYGRPIKADGTVSVKGEEYISNALDEKWQLVSLPQE